VAQRLHVHIHFQLSSTVRYTLRPFAVHDTYVVSDTIYATYNQAANLCQAFLGYEVRTVKSCVPTVSCLRNGPYRMGVRLYNVRHAYGVLKDNIMHVVLGPGRYIEGKRGARELSEHLESTCSLSLQHPRISWRHVKLKSLLSVVVLPGEAR
jgi:hypothetical protein